MKKVKTLPERSVNPGLQQGVRFFGIYTRGLSFEEGELQGNEVIEAADENGLESAEVGIAIEVNIMRGESALGIIADVTLRTTLTPDPRRQPYTVKVITQGRFVAPTSASLDGFDEFCRRAAPVIMWPYVRSLVSSVTADAVHGVLRLDPVNLTGILKEDAWIASIPEPGAKPK